MGGEYQAFCLELDYVAIISQRGDICRVSSKRNPQWCERGRLIDSGGGFSFLKSCTNN